jgi:branched-subunit amino acid aminotransferase/4-amino-4-deoxychorismate lyase
MAELNGSPATPDDLERLALTNYGHFTSMRVDDDGGVRGLSLHIARLVRDCDTVFGVSLDTERVLGYVRHAAHQHTGPFTVRVTVFDPNLTMGNIGDRTEPQILVTTRPAGPVPPPPSTAKTFVFSRDLAAVKHIGLFSQLRLRRAAQLAGFDDAIFVEADGRVSEGVTWNLGFVDRDGVVVWPDAPVLPGVTMQLLRDAHGDSATVPVALSDVGDMRAAFATNVSIGVRTIRAIDDVQFAIDDPTLDLLRKVYAELPSEQL